MLYIFRCLNFDRHHIRLYLQHAKAKGYEISIGRIGKLECDFILRGFGINYAYVQVAVTMMADRKTEDREYKPLEEKGCEAPDAPAARDRGCLPFLAGKI